MAVLRGLLFLLLWSGLDSNQRPAVSSVYTAARPLSYRPKCPALNCGALIAKTK